MISVVPSPGPGESMERSWLPDDDAQDGIMLAEEFQSLMASPYAATRRRAPLRSEPAREGDVIALAGDAESRRPRMNPLHGSFAAIADARTRRSAADWLESATRIKRDVARLRDTHYARHASVLLAVADALVYTEPADPGLEDDAGEALTRATALLSEPFVSETDEEALLTDLLERGWNLVPESGTEPPDES